MGTPSPWPARGRARWPPMSAPMYTSCASWMAAVFATYAVSNAWSRLAFEGLCLQWGELSADARCLCLSLDEETRAVCDAKPRSAMTLCCIEIGRYAGQLWLLYWHVADMCSARVFVLTTSCQLALRTLRAQKTRPAQRRNLNLRPRKGKPENTLSPRAVASPRSL